MQAKRAKPSASFAANSVSHTMRVGSGSSHTEESKIDANNLAYTEELTVRGSVTVTLCTALRK